VFETSFLLPHTLNKNKPLTPLSKMQQYLQQIRLTYHPIPIQIPTQVHPYLPKTKQHLQQIPIIHTPIPIRIPYRPISNQNSHLS
jgi:hypothetical protein